MSHETDSKKRLAEKDKENKSITREHSSMVKRFLLEMEKKKAELEIAQAHLSDALHSAERSQSERKEATLEAQKAAKASLYMEDHLKRLVHDRDEQISDIMRK